MPGSVVVVVVVVVVLNEGNEIVCNVAHITKKEKRKLCTLSYISFYFRFC